MTQAIALDTGHSRVGYINEYFNKFATNGEVRVSNPDENIKNEIEYYIFIDYSEYLVGYMIIEKEKIQYIIPITAKLHHYRDIKNKKSYIKSIKKVLDKNRIEQYLMKCKIKGLKDNLSVFVDIIEFIKRYNNCKIFASVDNNQFNSFVKLLDIVPHKNHVILVKESDLKKGSVEYKLSLIIDTMLNIERMSK